MNKPPTVSLCMIVRDEAATLGAAIESARDLVDEIIVTDTGSTDGTAEVARSCGAKVTDFPWCDDFAEARNASLAAAGSDWILVLDADEQLEPADSVAFGKLLADDEVAGYEVTLVNVGQDRSFPLVRLFRNDPAVRYCYPIHEQIVPALNTWAAIYGMRVERSPLVIRHSGYDPAKRQAKRPRNLRLLAKALAEFPEEAYLHFQLGAEGVSLFAGEVLPVAGMKEAAASLEKAWSLTAGAREGLPWLPDLASLLASSRMILGDPQGSLAVVLEAQKYCPGHERLALPLALATLEMGRRDSAALAALSGDISAMGLTLDEAPERRILGELEISLGNGELARQHFQANLKIDPEETFARLGMGRTYLAEGRHQEALAFIVKAVASSQWNWRAWLQGADLMEKMGLTDQAAQWRTTFNEQFPDHPEARSS